MKWTRALKIAISVVIVGWVAYYWRTIIFMTAVLVYNRLVSDDGMMLRFQTETLPVM
jgi:hypothetical protein